MSLFEISENIKIAFDSMKANKLRSLLASLGVVIGISFVILMGWVLKGLDQALDDTFNIIGTDMLYVDKWDWAGGRNWKLIQQRKHISLRQANEFCSRIRSAELSMPVVRSWQTVLKYESDEYTGISAQGTWAEYGLTPAGKVAQGRFFSEFETRSGANVVVLGHKVNQTIFPNGDAVGKTIKIQGRKYQVIGVITKQGTMLLDFVDNQVIMPLNSFLKTFGSFRRNISIAVKAGNVDNLDPVRTETQGLMREIRNLHPGDEDDFSINETKAFESQVATFRLWVWGIGIGMTILSFIVGIIGIMNIMFVSVTERTKEIGIRKAIGAKKSSILIQFIVESSALCFFGAIIAFIICSIIVFLLATFLPKVAPGTEFLSPIMPYQLLVIASAVSIFVGMAAGLIPAMRAANLNPVDALRYE